MKGQLLVCIAFHYSKERLPYLRQVVTNFLYNYGTGIKIIIDTNCDTIVNMAIDEKIEIIVHENLSHPFFLTWQHRKHIKEEIDNYETFIYTEDDMMLPFENYIAYLEKFKMLWPKYVPSFIRIEYKNGELYVSDIPTKHNAKNLGIIEIYGRKFVSFPFLHDYHAFWIMPQKELKETMKDDFVRVTDGREFAASYTIWEIGREGLVEVYEKNSKLFIDPSCYSYHLPNTYALGDGKNGKIKVEEIFL